MLTRAVKINHSKGLPDLVYRKDPEGAFVESTITGVPTAVTPYPFPSLFFLLTSFSVCSLHGPHKLNATGPDEFLPVQPV